MSSNGDLNKGLDSKLVQDFYRAISDKKGNIKFNHIKVVNIAFVKHDGCNKIYAFNVPCDKRLKEGQKVVVDTSRGEQLATVVSSIKIQQKYVKNLLYAITGRKGLKLKNVIGVYTKTRVDLNS